MNQINEINTNKIGLKNLSIDVINSNFIIQNYFQGYHESTYNRSFFQHTR